MRKQVLINVMQVNVQCRMYFRLCGLNEEKNITKTSSRKKPHSFKVPKSEVLQLEGVLYLGGIRYFHSKTHTISVL